MARRAAAAKPSAESDQKPASDDCDVTSGHLRRRHRIPNERRSDRRGDKAGNKGGPPGAIARVRVDEASENSADPGNASSGQSEQNSRKPDQRAADCCGDRSEIAHDITIHCVALAGGCHLVTAIRLAGAALYDPACRATARERAMEVRIVLPVRVPVGTSPISMPVAMMVVVMLLSESRTATRY